MNTQVRLTRSATDKVIGGVCGGLAHYFGIDPVIVRLIFVAMIFAGGISILLYPILWLIMPLHPVGQPSLNESWQEMQQAGQIGEGARTLGARVEAAFGSAQPRFDPQTGQPLPQAGRNNHAIGIALLGLGLVMLSSFFPGGSSLMIALMFLVGGFYLLRRTS